MASHRDNCYDFLRLLLASAVLYDHAYVVCGANETVMAYLTRQQTYIGSLAVLGFFGLSGMLVSASFERSGGIVDFFKKRVVRLMPAFWVCIALTAFFFAPVLLFLKEGSLAQMAWVGKGSSLSYVYENLFLSLHQFSIGDILVGKPAPGDLNGSLWSLYPEFQCYVMTFILGWLGLLSRGRWLLALFTAYVYFLYVFTLIDSASARALGPQIFVLNGHNNVYVSYLTGMVLYAFRDYITVHWKSALALILFSGLTLRNGGFLLVAPVVVPISILAVGRSYTLRLKNDFSYGMYIYGYPIQLVLSSFEWIRTSMPLMLFLSFICTYAFGALSWFLVERPVLRKFKRVRVIES